MSGDRPRRYQPFCTVCSWVDVTTTAIAGSRLDGERALRAQGWRCPSCGSDRYITTTPYRDGDLEDTELRPNLRLIGPPIRQKRRIRRPHPTL